MKKFIQKIGRWEVAERCCGFSGGRRYSSSQRREGNDTVIEYH